MLVLIHLDDDNAVLSLHDEVYPNESLGFPVEPDRDLTSKFNALGLQVAFYAFLMDLDSSTATTFLMPVAMATLAKPTAA